MTTPFDQNDPTMPMPTTGEPGTSGAPAEPTGSTTSSAPYDRTYQIQPDQLFQAIHSLLTTGATFTLDTEDATNGTFTFHSYDGMRFSATVTPGGDNGSAVRLVSADENANGRASDFFDALDRSLGVTPAPGTHGGRGGQYMELTQKKTSKLAVVSVVAAVLFALMAFNGSGTVGALVVLAVVPALLAGFSVYVTRKNSKVQGRVLAWVAVGIIAVSFIVGAVRVAIDNANDDAANDIQCTAYTWPISDLGGMIPQPESTTGEVNYDSSDSFSISVCNVDDEQFNSYIDSVIEQGFDVDYSRSSDSYYADNADSYSVSIDRNYNDETVMDIRLSAPPEEEEGDTTDDGTAEGDGSADDTSSDDTSADTSDDQSASQSDGDDSAQSDDFTAAMDSYEELMNEYVDFMVKYQDEGSPASMFTDYLSMLDTYQEAMDKLDAIDEDSLTDEQLQYYLEVVNRVNQRLLEVSQ